MQFFEANDVNQINYWALEGHPIGKIVSRFGFLDGRSKWDIFFGVRRVPEIWDEISKFKPERIHLQFGDIDWI